MTTPIRAITRAAGLSGTNSLLIASACLALLGNLQHAFANPPLTGAVQITSRGSHACAVIGDGSVKCWGRNHVGQLGNGTLTDAPTATPVPSLLSGIVAVAAGLDHTCALTSGGAVKCWGQNTSGQSGTGNLIGSRIPVDVVGLGSGVAAIVAGDNHSCALTSTGGVKCWGANGDGQLGNAMTTNSPMPVDVVGLTSGVSAIAASFGYTCALTTTAGAKCWGSNNSGQLGNASFTSSSIPVDVSGLASGVTAIYTGSSHACAMTSGGVKCWGNNHSGQLGTGSSPIGSWIPVDAAALPPGVTSLALGGGFSCAITATQTVKCFGYNLFGELGNGTLVAFVTPTDVERVPAPVQAITAGGGQACALLAGGAVKCWGTNSNGQAGNGTTWLEPVPIAVSMLGADANGLAIFGTHACRVNSVGGVECWGANERGQLGTFSQEQWLSPAAVFGLGSGAVRVAVGSSHSCAVTTAGGVKCWGQNIFGQLGNGTFTDSHAPADVSGPALGATAIVAGAGHTCVLTSGGGMKCWGANYFGELGSGFMADTQWDPLDVAGLTSGVAAMAVGVNHTCALTTAGGVKCWGLNSSGQLGAAMPSLSYFPLDVTGLASGASAIAAGSDHSCALVAGGVKCWGNNANGQLGNGGTTSSPTPTDVAGATSGIAAIAASGSNTCALTTAGQVKCWGYNADGQLGNGTYQESLVPADVHTGTAVAIHAGGGHSCAILIDGSVKCWGSNRFGQFPNGKAGYYAYPVSVLVAGCAGFDDIDTTNAFCANVEWARNRNITLGCASTTFCASNDVTRLAMAAFSERAASAFTIPSVDFQQGSGALDPDQAPIVCITADFDVVSFPRHARLDAIVTATATGDVALAFTLVASFDGAQTWQDVAASPGSIKAGRWMNLRAMGELPIAPGAAPRIGLRIDRGGQPGAVTLNDSACVMRARIDNRNGATAPFDGSK